MYGIIVSVACFFVYSYGYYKLTLMVLENPVFNNTDTQLFSPTWEM